MNDQKPLLYAPSILEPDEVNGLLGEALADLNCRASMTVVRCCQVGSQELLSHSSLRTHEGTIHRVAIIRIPDRELVWDFGWYTEEADAITVWEYHATEYLADRPRTRGRQA